MIRCTTTRINTHEIEYIWIIDDFPLLRTLSSKHALPNKDRIFSPNFGNDEAGTWFLALFPSGVNCDGKFMSIYLYKTSESDKVASFEISILDNSLCSIDGSTISTSQPRVFCAEHPSWGWEDYMKITHIQNFPINEIENQTMCETSIHSITSPFGLDSNSTILQVESNIIENEVNTHVENFEQSCFNSIEKDFYFNWKKTILKYFVFNGSIRFRVVIKSFNEFNHIEENLVGMCTQNDKEIRHNLRLAKDFSNFSLNCSESSTEIISIICGEKCFKVPKFTLAARSEYFRKIFDSNFSDSKKTKFTIPLCEATPYTLKNILDFISVGDCELLNTNFKQKQSEFIKLFEFSDKYGIASLYEACVPIIIENINTHSIWEVIISAKRCNSNAILKAAEDFIKSKSDIYTLASSLINHLNKT
ncbi:POZ domain protein that is fused to a MATH domain at its N-terminus [Cryptosporidium ryanae]|uniref:POZ domain protein that is fused to a MATH domain at its N-terminus n=1 Tax=Cryptosporidium ryanae TaxID=515981 RepID=UPI00351A25BA|nr:POZ domain protein that is fused to a MATH domain at its N-terminus [Cryptosporidium ryanae]